MTVQNQPVPQPNRRAAELIHDALAATLGPLADSRDRVACTAPEPEQVDLIAALLRIREQVTPLAGELLSGARPSSNSWLALADTLGAAASLCRKQITLGC